MLTLKLLTPIHMVLMKQIQPTPTASAWKHFFKVCSDIGSVYFPVTWGASWSPFLNPYNTRVMDDANCGSRLTNDRKACFFGSYTTGAQSDFLFIINTFLLDSFSESIIYICNMWIYVNQAVWRDGNGFDRTCLSSWPLLPSVPHSSIGSMSFQMSIDRGLCFFVFSVQIPPWLEF